MILGWPVPPRGGTKYEDWKVINRFRSEAKRAAYIHATLPVNVVLQEANDD